jgi:hypothetical protein
MYYSMTYDYQMRIRILPDSDFSFRPSTNKTWQWEP